MFKPVNKWSVLDEIKSLDPYKDNQRIAFLSAAYDFPWDTQRAYELALLRSFAVPKSSSLLLATGEFTERTQKRYDDTSIIISTIGLYGYDSPQGRAAIRRMNQIHAHYTIPNDEYLYVLSTFIFEPIRWNEQYGWRPLSPQEKLAGFYFWSEVGKCMNIQHIPVSFEAFAAYKQAYETEYFAFDPANHQLASATRDLFLSWFLPKFLWPFGAHFVYALMDTQMRQAFGFPDPHPLVSLLVKGSLRARALLLRFLPPRRTPYRLPETRTYPAGYEIQQLGPETR